MKRRQFITLLGGAAATWPLRASAQQPALPLVGFLSVGTNSDTHRVGAFRRGLAETGYIEGWNVAVEYRFAQNQPARLRALAADLVSRRVSVIVTPGNALAAVAAKALSSTVPIVFSMGGDPVQSGLVASLNRPGGNATGFTEMNVEVTPKRLELGHELVPAAKRFALLIESHSLSGPPGFTSTVQAAASTMGLQIELIYASGTIAEIEAAIEDRAQRDVGAILVNPSQSFGSLRAEIAALMARKAIPAIFYDRAFPDAGGLMSYGSSVGDLFRQVGVYAGRILKGEKPADLPVQQPTKFELVINLKTARALNLQVPDKLLALADEVIE
jgi:putative ABC transport system substrate-binding protein